MSTGYLLGMVGVTVGEGTKLSIALADLLSHQSPPAAVHTTDQLDLRGRTKRDRPPAQLPSDGAVLTHRLSARSTLDTFYIAAFTTVLCRSARKGDSSRRNVDLVHCEFLTTD